MRIVLVHPAGSNWVPGKKDITATANRMAPLGLLSIVAVANGIFAQFRLRGGWSELQLQAQDIQRIRTSDVMALVEHVQQVSVETVDGLAQLLARSPTLAGSAAAALLTSWLLQRAKNRRATDRQD